MNSESTEGRVKGSNLSCIVASNQCITELPTAYSPHDSLPSTTSSSQGRTSVAVNPFNTKQTVTTAHLQQRIKAKEFAPYTLSATQRTEKPDQSCSIAYSSEGKSSLSIYPISLHESYTTPLSLRPLLTRSHSTPSLPVNHSPPPLPPAPQAPSDECPAPTRPFRSRPFKPKPSSHAHAHVHVHAFPHDAHY